MEQPRIAVVIPCYNEEQTIVEVIRDFQKYLPESQIFVFDNNSTDRTAELARNAGATVRHERRQGKGYVVQAMFREVDADLVVMVDGDTTYPADVVRALIEPVSAGSADMAIGSRLHRVANSQFRPLNRLGNLLYRWLLNSIFGVKLTDLLSGYRVFSRRLIRALPLVSGGFEIEAEMTIKAIERGFTIVEVPVNLTSRPEGSHSKIRMVHDGWLILSTILTLFRDYKPLTFFGGLGLTLILAGAVPGVMVLADYVKVGTMSRPGMVVLSLGLVIVGAMSIFSGLILHSIARRFQELDRQMLLFEAIERRSTDKTETSGRNL